MLLRLQEYVQNTLAGRARISRDGPTGVFTVTVSLHSGTHHFKNKMRLEAIREALVFLGETFTVEDAKAFQSFDAMCSLAKGIDLH